MRRFSRLISLLVLTMWAGAATVQAQQVEAEDGSTDREYQLLMEVRGRDITGLCLMSTDANGQVVGTVVNEMGVKAFDFTYADGKAKVLNVIGPMNKWYIRKVLRADFSFLLQHINDGHDAVWKKRSLTMAPDGVLVLRNGRYHINYTFTPQHSDS